MNTLLHARRKCVSIFLRRIYFSFAEDIFGEKRAGKPCLLHYLSITFYVRALCKELPGLKAMDSPPFRAIEEEGSRNKFPTFFGGAGIRNLTDTHTRFPYISLLLLWKGGNYALQQLYTPSQMKNVRKIGLTHGIVDVSFPKFKHFQQFFLFC